MDDATLKRLQAVELEILLAVDAVCKECGICYFLDSGTLLGAARHGGFIPWDDDVDIAMPREDYDRFLEIGQRALGDAYFLQTRETDPETFISFAKVRKKGTLCLEKANERRAMNNGIWIDVFPFDRVLNEPSNLRRKEVAWWFRHKLLTLRTVEEADSKASTMKKVIRKLVRLPLLARSRDAYYKSIELLPDRDVSDRDAALTCFHYYTQLPFLEVDDVFPLATLDFEGHTLPVVGNWEKYLNDVYGNWRELPSPSERCVHEVLELDFGDELTDFLAGQAKSGR